MSRSLELKVGVSELVVRTRRRRAAVGGCSGRRRAETGWARPEPRRPRRARAAARRLNNVHCGPSTHSALRTQASIDIQHLTIHCILLESTPH